MKHCRGVLTWLKLAAGSSTGDGWRKTPQAVARSFEGELLLLQSSEQGAFGSACRAPRRDCFCHNQGQ
jgi:hypothetical protein